MSGAERTAASSGRPSAGEAARAEDGTVQLPQVCLGHVAGYLPPGCFSRFRNVDRFHRRELYAPLVEVLAALAGPPSLTKSWAKALRRLGQIAEQGDGVALRVVAARLEDADWKVRSHAVRAFALLAKSGDAGAIAAVSARLADEDGNVRRAAVDALGAMEKGD